MSVGTEGDWDLKPRREGAAPSVERLTERKNEQLRLAGGQEEQRLNQGARYEEGTGMGHRWLEGSKTELEKETFFRPYSPFTGHCRAENGS